MIIDVIPRRTPSVACRALDGEAVLVDAEHKKITVLNGVGARIWEMADGQHTIGDMARAIVKEYEVSPEKAESDALAFCHDLAGRGLLTLES